MPTIWLNDPNKTTSVKEVLRNLQRFFYLRSSLIFSMTISFEIVVIIFSSNYNGKHSKEGR